MYGRKSVNNLYGLSVTAFMRAADGLCFYACHKAYMLSLLLDIMLFE